MLLAVATSQNLAQLPPDERALLRSLAEVGIPARAAIWSARETDWSEFGAVVVRSCWDYHLRVEEFRRWIDRLREQNIGVLNSPALIYWNIDKRYLRELSNLGIPIPGTTWIEPGQSIEVAELCRARGWARAVVKPLISASAHGTERTDAGAVHGPMMIQEYLTEIESDGEWSLMYFNGVFSHAVRKRAKTGDFRVQSDFGGTAELAIPPPNLLKAADTAMSLLPSTPVFARVDIVERGSSALLMELELIEPELFVTLAPGASDRLALAIQAAIRS